MKRMRILLYGGTDLQGTPVDFISELAYQILESMPSVIVTGGFRHSNRLPNAISTDVAALKGAQRYSAAHQIDLKDCFEAWIPDPSLDSRSDVGGAVRLNEADGVTLRIMEGRTPLGRRLAMVAGVDIVVTIAGKRHTEVVVEQALDLGLPVLPIPNVGGDSKALLKKYRERISTGFDPGALDECLNQLDETINHDPEHAADAVIELIRTAKVRKCLLLFPYDEEHNDLVESVIKPAVSKHMIPVRLDYHPSSEQIYTNFAEAESSSSAVIADITTLNWNVMYEIGYSHGCGLKPLLFTRDKSRLDDLPVYLRNLNIRFEAPGISLESIIDDYLSSLKKTHRMLYSK